VLSAVKRGLWQDYTGMILAVSGISFPPFWLGLLLINLFSVQLGWLPTGGYGDWKSFLMPSFTLGLGVAAVMARFTRSAFIETAREDYVRTARAKGVPERRVIWRHALRNALIPIITMVGLQFGFLLGGSIVVESVFSWPGVGRLLVDSVSYRDYPVIQALVLMFSLEFILINLCVDILYVFANPEIRYK
ncbi:ABC transporter permease subunit, partial [Thioclava sp. BHET1]